MTWRLLVFLLLFSQLSTFNSQLLRAAEVYGQFLNANSTPYTNEVLFRALSTPLNANPRIIAGGDFRVTPDTNGNFTLQLQPGDYRVFSRLDSKGFIISVPDGTNSYLINSRITSALTYTPAAMILGSATNVPKAAAATSGLVKTESSTADPVVYLKATVDDLLSAKADIVAARGDYEVYSPTVTRSFLVNPATSPWQYNHDSSIAYWRGKYWAVWNANTDQREDQPGQVNLLSTSTDLTSWTTPIEPFNSSTYSENPTPTGSERRQWQPSLIVVNDELWCIWMQDFRNLGYPNGYRPYFSRLTSPTGKWVNTEITNRLTINGRGFWAFPTQNPIQLKSGRVLAPVTWQSTNFVYTTGYPTNAYFWANEKRSGVLVSDDLGVTWRVGGYTTFPNESSHDWEPVVDEMPDGRIRMFTRNLNRQTYVPYKGHATAVGTSGGDSFGPLEYVYAEVASSRLGLIKQDGAVPRLLGLQNDWRPAGSTDGDRYNGAIFFNRSGHANLTPGPGWSGTDTVVAYPQGLVNDGKVVLTYSQGAEPRAMKVAVLDPAPDPAKWYLTPRSNDKINPLVEWTNGPTARFVYGPASSMRSTISTVDWGAETLVSVGSWTKRDSTLNYAIFDNRDLPTGSGFAFAVLNSKPRLVLYNAGGVVASNYDFTSLTVPTGEWVYLGVSLNGTQAVCYMVTAAGSMTSQTISVAAYNQLGGATAYFGGATAGSSIGTITGSVRHIVVQRGVSWDANAHRYWHGVDQTALGATDWSGTEASAGTPEYDFWAANPDAGLNNTAWLALWDQTGSTFRGDCYATTVDGKSALLVTGTGSAGVEVPFIRASQQYVFGTEFWLGTPSASSDRVIATIGDALNKVMVLTRAGTPTVLEVYSQVLGRYETLGSVVDGVWTPLQIRIGGGQVSVSIDTYPSVAVPMNVEQPFFFLGQGYLRSASMVPSSQVAFRLDCTGFTLEGISRLYNTQTVRQELTDLSITAPVPVLRFKDSDDSVETRIFGVGRRIRFSGTNNTLIADTTMELNTATGELLLQADQTPRIQIKGYGPSANPVVRGIGIGGSKATNAATADNQLLIGIRGAGHDGVNETTSKGSFDLIADGGTWTTNSTGTRWVLSLVQNGTTTLVPVAVWDGDLSTALSGALSVAGALTVTGNATFSNISTMQLSGNAPMVSFLATNGNSGGRLKFSGTGVNMARFLDEYELTRHTWYTNGFYELVSGGGIRFGTSGPEDLFGSGVPTASKPNGSTYRRTDGTGPNFYVRENGVWVAK